MSITIIESNLLPVRRDKQITSVASTGNIGSSSPAVGSGGGSTTNHALLTNLDYASAGHTGFAPIADPTFTGTVTTPSLIVTDLTDGYLPYQKAADDKLSDSCIYTDGTYIGIGIVPLNILHIYHANLVPVIKLEGQLDSGVHEPTIVMKDDRGAGYAGVSIRGSRDVSSGGHSIIFATTADNSAEVAGTLSDRVWINRGGNVGINTSSPDATLEVVGTFMLSSDASSPSFFSGFAGSGWKLDEESGIYSLTVDNLTVRQMMRVYELEINKISSINGGIMISVANGKAYSLGTGNESAYFKWVATGFDDFGETFESSGLEITHAIESTGEGSYARAYWTDDSYQYPILSGITVTVTGTLVLNSGTEPIIRFFEDNVEVYYESLVVGVNSIEHEITGDCDLKIEISTIPGNCDFELSSVNITTDENKIVFDEDEATAGTGNIIQFEVNDYIRAQEWTGRGVDYYLGQVTNVIHSDVLGSAFIVVTHITGTPWVGAELVQVGNSSETDRQNIIYITASDTDNPYIDMLTGVDDGVFAGKQALRIGNLAGIEDPDFDSAYLTGFGLYADNVCLKGGIIASFGEIGGFIITATELYAGSGATRVEMQAAGGFWAGATAIGDAPFSVTVAGVLKATGVAEFGTNTAEVDSKASNIAILGPDIWENAYDGDSSAVWINRLGFDGGADHYRDLVVMDGKGSNKVFGIAGGATTLISFGNSGLTSVAVSLTGTLNMNSIPTSGLGLSAGDVYRDGAGADATLKIK